MVVGALITGLFASTDPEPWSIRSKKDDSISNQYVINDNYVY
jgi:hypothetical protein